MKSILCCSSMREKVKEIHSYFKTPKEPIDLIDFAILPQHGSDIDWDDPNSPIIQKIRKMMMTPTPRFNESALGEKVYDITACSYLAKRAELLQEFPEIATKPLASLTVENLEDISLGATGPMQAYFIKHAVLRLKYKRTYKGMQPYTSPVDKITRILYGKPMDNYRHTVLCIELAQQLKVYPTYINTAFWILGQRLSKKK